MGYRDELGAAEERIRILEDQLAEARAEISRLSAPAALAPPAIPAAPAPLARAPSRRLGTLHFHPPPTYWPTLRLLAVLVRAAGNSAPVAPELRSDNVAVWAFHYAVRWPLTVVAWPLYWLSMVLLVLPIAAMICLVGAAPLFVVAVLARLTFSPVPPESGPLLAGEVTDEAGRTMLWTICSLFVIPLLFSGRLLRPESPDD